VGNSVPVARMLGGITVHELIDALRVGSASAPSASLSIERTAATNGEQHSTLAMLERLES
jgi:mycobactin polyketide synthetase MbtD